MSIEKIEKTNLTIKSVLNTILVFCLLFGIYEFLTIGKHFSVIQYIVLYSLLLDLGKYINRRFSYYLHKKEPSFNYVTNEQKDETVDISFAPYQLKRMKAILLTIKKENSKEEVIIKLNNDEIFGLNRMLDLVKYNGKNN